MSLFPRKDPDLDPDRETDSGWFLTYADLMSLLLVFFVFLVSFSDINPQKFSEAMDSFNQQESGEIADKLKETPSKTDYVAEPQTKVETPQEQLARINREALERETKIQNTLMYARAFLKENALEGQVSAIRIVDDVALVLADNLLFRSGDAEILDGAKPILDRLIPLLQELPNEIKIEGHTDNRPIRSARFPSNWELSAARSSQVVRYLTLEKGLPTTRFIAVGYADTRPVASNNDNAGRQRNRRVVINLTVSGESISKK